MLFSNTQLFSELDEIPRNGQIVVLFAKTEKASWLDSSSRINANLQLVCKRSKLDDLSALRPEACTRKKLVNEE